MAEWLIHIAKYHNEWVRLVRSWGEQDYAEDLVQETYLKLLKYTTEEKIVKDGEVNKAYVWFALRSVFISYVNEKNRVSKISIDFDLTDENTDTEKEDAYRRLLDKIEEEKDSWHWYDKLLLDTYVYRDVSMRELAEGSNISLTSIFNTIKNCKQRIKDTIEEDYLDFNNEDYERI